MISPNYESDCKAVADLRDRRRGYQPASRKCFQFLPAETNEK
jgi:hypothetical protein